MKKTYTLKQLADILNAKVIGSGDVVVTELTSLDQAGESEMSYIDNLKYVSAASDSNAAAIMLAEPMKDFNKPQLIVKNIDSAVIEILGLFAPEIEPVKAGIDPSAIIDSNAEIDPTASIGPHVCVAKGAVVGKNCIVGANVNIGQNVTIGDNTRLDCNVVIYHNCRIGSNCLVQAATVIGSLGFGYSFIDGQHKFIPHNRAVVIEDFVHIGANCCIDRGKFVDTIIGAGTKMDNLVQVGHGTQIGKCCIVVSYVGFGGSTRVGNGVVIAGQVGIANHSQIGDGARIGAKSGIKGTLAPGGEYLGAPAIDAREEFKLILARQKMPEMIKQIKKLSKRIEALESAANNS